MRVDSISVTLVVALLSMALPAHAEPPLDYARSIRQSSMVFIPYVGMQRGPIYYTEYEQVPTETARVFDLRRIIVNLFPVAHRQGLYNSFISQHGIVDARVLPLPGAGECRPTEEIQRMLAGMPEGYRPHILPGNYPILCSLSLYFLPEDEPHIRRVIDSRPVITLHASLPLCAPDSPRVDVPAVAQALQAEGVLQPVPSGDLEGNYWELLYSSVVLAQGQPQLFSTPVPRVGWQELMERFVLERDTQVARLPASTARYPLYMCSPAPLEISFGQPPSP
jgi:hypothetical protein